MIEFLVNNLFDSSVKVASTTNAQYPISNLLDDRRTKVWRSTSNSANIVIDMGSPEDVDSIMIVDNWRDGFGFTTAVLEGNGTDSWGSPAFTTTLDIDAVFGVANKTFSTQSYRFWRLALTSSLAYCELSNLFIGKKSALTANGVNYNWSYANNSLDRKSVNRYGQAFFDIIGSQKTLTNLSFTVMNKDEIDIIHAIDDVCGLNKGFYVSFPLDTPGLVTNDNRYNGFYRLTETPVFENTTSGYFSVALNLEECK